MAKKESALRAIMLVHQLEEKYWLSPECKDTIQKAENGDCRPLLDVIVKKLQNNDIIPIEAYIIKHDKDEISIWDAKELKNVIKKKLSMYMFY